MTFHPAHGPEEEIAPGILCRRQVLFLPILGMLPQGGERRPRAADWKRFLEAAVPAAVSSLAEKPLNEDAYLYGLAAIAARLGDVPIGDFKPFGKLDPAVELDLIHRGSPFIVIHWRMRPHAVLPAHNHPKASVCTVALEGEARIRNFEVEGEAPASDSGSSEVFRIRETKSEILRKGRINTLSRTRDNIHYFEAGADGARGIDITTGHGGEGSFSFMRFTPERPLDPKRRVFEAVWVGKKPTAALARQRRG